MRAPHANQPTDQFRLTSDQAAEHYLVEPPTVRKQLGKNESYRGVHPLPSPNQKLRRPTDHMKRLAAKEEA